MDLADQLAEVDRLKSRMIKKILYVMNREIIDPSKLQPAMLDHYRWIIDLEKADKVFASGPLFDEDGVQGVGMTIFRADGFDEAVSLAASDPFCIAGAAIFTLHRWQINEGRIRATFDMSDQTYTLA